MPDKRLARIAERLYEKTLKGEIKWVRTAKPDTFQCSFPNYGISITQITPLDDFQEPYIKMNIFNGSGEAIESIMEEDLREVIDDVSVSEMLTSLYVNARRSAFGIDKALDEILWQLD